MTVTHVTLMKFRNHKLLMNSLRRGFTLLEVLVVVTISAVVTSLSMGQFASLLAHERVSHAAVGIADDLRMAFAVPGRVRRPVRVQYDSTNMQLLIMDRDQSTTYRKTAFGSRYNLTTANVAVYPESAWIEIYPTGFASDTMVITLSSQGYSRSIKVTRGGMVEVRPQ